MAVLITGGAGYIGSHTIYEILAAGGDAVAVDNLSNGNCESIRRVEMLTGKKVRFFEADVCDRDALRQIFKTCTDIDGAIHFAGYKAVGESVAKPLKYYKNNLGATVTLLEVMEEFKVRNLVFSSSATVYGANGALSESMPIGTATNPYGTTKIMCEQIIRDAARANPELNAVILRYFNPVGAHESGQIGEDPCGIPNNLMPYITQVAVGKLEQLRIFGNDYPTRDGTCIRDYIHVVDLAKGHLCALKKMEKAAGVFTYNLGTGNGVTVLEIVQAFQKATGVEVPFVYAPRRDGDLTENYAVTDLAQQELGWRAERDIEQMCRDHYSWQKKNPKGYLG